MGFLLGITHKHIGDVYVYAGSLKKDVWSYMSNGELRRDGYFFDDCFQVNKHVIAVSELFGGEDRKQITVDIRRLLGPYTAADLLVVGAALTAPILVPAAATLQKKLKDRSGIPPIEAFTCFEATLRDGRKFYAVATRNTFEALASRVVPAVTKAESLNG